VLTQLLDVFSFISVLLRGAALALESLILGGVVFSFWILRPLSVHPDSPDGGIMESSRRLIAWSALGLAFVQICYVMADSVLLTGTTGLGWRDLAGAGFFISGSTSAVVALITAAIVRRRGSAPRPALMAASMIILSTLVATSHAAGRMEGRAGLLALSAIHMLAVGCWVGGLPYLMLTLTRAPNVVIRRWVCRRFSKLAALSVAVLASAGWLLSYVYVGSREAVYGTSYGAMVVSKVMLFAALLLLGGLNFLIVRRIATADDRVITKLRRFAEAEIGIGFTVIFAAASLTSQPPAVDLGADRVALSEIVQRFTPRWPTFSTPPAASLSPATPIVFDTEGNASRAPQSYVPGTLYQPSTPNDIAWSEYNHHWAGAIVLLVGLLALGARLPGLGWARNWPLAFLALAVFLFLRADPENWPLGPRGFWESFLVAEVLQHRLFVVLIVLFGFFEWGVTTGRISSPRAALVFPGVCAVGGALLLTHAHPLGNIKEALLSELSHIPLGILGVVAGWSRWLEWRAVDSSRRILCYIWPVCFVLVGLILLNYRES
jgi:copper resistance protein D